MALVVWTIGHSTHPLDRLVELLHARGIERVADVRTVPRSGRHPHVHADALRGSLPARGIGYVHVPALGGWRRPAEDSPNGAWRNRSFRGYADYALTREFSDGLADLCAMARDERVAVMCSEALWWRCHRRLIADRLVVAGHEVRHIGSGGAVTEHRLTPFAVVADGRITYPAVDG